MVGHMRNVIPLVWFDKYLHTEMDIERKCENNGFLKLKKDLPPFRHIAIKP